MALRELRLFDDRALHLPCRPVEAVDDRVRALLRDMAETMYHTQNGAGLAACQIGVLRRLVVIDLGEGLLQLVNPRLVGASGEQLCLEGCLSFPGRWASTMRPFWVSVQALDEWGNELLLEGEGELAKCFCHELDHLDGISLPDRALEWIEL